METKNPSFHVCIRLLDTTEISNKKRKRTQPYIGKILVITNGLIYHHSYTGAATHSTVRRQLASILDGEGYIGTDGSQHFHISDIRKQLRSIMKEQQIGVFSFPLHMSVFGEDNSTFSVSKFEILNYLSAPVVDHALTSLQL